MRNIEKPLTWVLVIVSLGLLFLEKYDNLEVRLENGGNGIYGILITDEKVETKDINLSEDRNLNADSLSDIVPENIDTEGRSDTVIKIDLTE